MCSVFWERSDEARVSRPVLIIGRRHGRIITVQLCTSPLPLPGPLCPSAPDPAGKCEVLPRFDPPRWILSEARKICNPPRLLIQKRSSSGRGTPDCVPRRARKRCRTATRAFKISLWQPTSLPACLHSACLTPLRGMHSQRWRSPSGRS